MDKLLGDKPVTRSQEGRLNNVETKLEYEVKRLGDAQKEMGDLTSEQQVHQNFCIKCQVQALNDSLGDKQDKQSEEMREMIMELKSLAKNTGMTQQEIINLTKE